MCWSLEYLFLSFLSAVFHCYLYSSFVSVAVGVMKKSETDVLITDRFWSFKGVAFRRVLSFFRCEASFLNCFHSFLLHAVVIHKCPLAMGLKYLPLKIEDFLFYLGVI